MKHGHDAEGIATKKRKEKELKDTNMGKDFADWSVKDQLAFLALKTGVI